MKLEANEPLIVELLERIEQLATTSLACALARGDNKEQLVALNAAVGRYAMTYAALKTKADSL